jgi:pimeloyl-ACP methyl ester carboxylesterase
MTGAELTVRTLAPGAPGAPVVAFAHGLEDSWTSWQPVAGALDPAWRLLALDLPWRPGNDYRWRRRAAGAWLGQALDLIDTVPDVLVAHSYGANAALDLLCELDPRPGRAVALVCPLYRLPRHPVTWRMFERARAMFVENIQEGLRARIGVRAATMEPDVLETMLDVAVDRVGPSGFMSVFEQFAHSAHLPLGNVRLPTLVLAGGNDPTLSPEAAAELRAGMPGAELRFHDEYDHFCHIRHATSVAAHIAELVTACTATPRAGELL